MSVSIPTPENIKSKAKVARQFLKDRCGKDLSHSQCIELISQLFGFKDWNTANAELPPIEPFERVKFLASIRSPKRPEFVDSGLTVGDLRKALEPYDDSATLDCDFEYNLGEFMNEVDDLASPEDDIQQEFAVTSVEKINDTYVSLRLALKNETFSSPS